MTRMHLTAGILFLPTLAYGHDNPASVLPYPGIQVQGRSIATDTVPNDCGSIEQLTEVYSVASGSFVQGDTDNDGNLEIIASVKLNGTFSIRILENQGNNEYVEVFVGPDIIPYASGDFDQDGKAEILGQVSDHLVIYESPTTTTHPSLLTWQSSPLINVIGYATAADTDGDGLTELIHSANTFTNSSLVVYENSGDDTFDQVFSSAQQMGYSGPQLVANLQGDARPEIVLSVITGYLYIYEAVGNNSWQERAVVNTNLSNALEVTGGSDTDGNGRPEIFTSGDEGGVGLRRTRVYEFDCTGVLTHVADLDFFDGNVGVTRNAVANLDGLGRDELIINLSPGLLVYHAVALGQWSPRCIVPDLGLYNSFLVFDANKNGRPEIFWSETGSAELANTVVLEHAEGSPSDVPEANEQIGFLAYPNPCRNQTTLLLKQCLQVGSGTIATYDVAGHLLFRVPLPSGSQRIGWPPVPQPSGVYFVRLEGAAGAPVASQRVILRR